MTERTEKYYLVEASALPEVFTRVVEAKKLLAQGKAKNLSHAAALSGLSRSALYKYKDSIFIYNENITDNILTFSASLEDEPGVLSAVLTALYRHGANVLTINQNIPVDGTALVSFSVRFDPARHTQTELVDSLGKVHGVVETRILSTR